MAPSAPDPALNPGKDVVLDYDLTVYDTNGDDYTVDGPYEITITNVVTRQR